MREGRATPGDDDGGADKVEVVRRRRIDARVDQVPHQGGGLADDALEIERGRLGHGARLQRPHGWDAPRREVVADGDVDGRVERVDDEVARDP
jgi:hypothetical protein